MTFSVSTKITLPSEDELKGVSTHTLIGGQGDINNNNNLKAVSTHIPLSGSTDGPVHGVSTNIGPSPLKKIDLDPILKGRKRASDAMQKKVKDSFEFLTIDQSGVRLGSEVANPQAELLDNFLVIRDVLLFDERADLVDTVEDFFLNYTMESAEYTDPETGDRRVIDLHKLSDPAVKKYIDTYLDVADEAFHVRKNRPFNISHKSKGSVKGAHKALQRNSKGLQKLSKSFEEVSQNLLPQLLQTNMKDPKLREIALNAFLHAESIQRQTLKELDKKIKEVDQKYRAALVQQKSDSKARPEVKKLLEQLIKMRELQGELADVDAAALAIAFVHFPTQKKVYSEEREVAAKKMRQYVETLLDVNNQKRLDRTDLLKEKEYAKDVAGMVHQRRYYYYEYTQKVDIPFKRESFTDVLFREMIIFEGAKIMGEESPDPETLYSNDYISPEIEESVKPILLAAHKKFSDCDKVDVNALTSKEYPANGDKAMQKKVDQENLTSIQNEITRVREAIQAKENPPAPPSNQ